jgi:hypothetical protein
MIFCFLSDCFTFWFDFRIIYYYYLLFIAAQSKDYKVIIAIIWSTGHVNGVNVIGLSMRSPVVPGLALLKPTTQEGLLVLITYQNIKLILFFSFTWRAGNFLTVPQIHALQPRAATVGKMDLMVPLAPRLLVPLGKNQFFSNEANIQTFSFMAEKNQIPFSTLGQKPIEFKLTLHNDDDSKNNGENCD